MRTTLTAFVPAHKQTDPQHAPGQIVNPVNPLGFTDQTLGDYIRRKDKIHAAFDDVAAEQKKLSFDNWWLEEARNFPHLATSDAEFIWKAAQEHT